MPVLQFMHTPIPEDGKNVHVPDSWKPVGIREDQMVWCRVRYDADDLDDKVQGTELLLDLVMRVAEERLLDVNQRETAVELREADVEEEMTNLTNARYAAEWREKAYCQRLDDLRTIKQESSRWYMRGYNAGARKSENSVTHAMEQLHEINEHLLDCLRKEQPVLEGIG